MTSPLRLALLQYPIEPVPDLSAWSAKLDRWLAPAAASGAQIALLPEYACLELAAALATNASPAGEMTAMLEHTGEIVAAMRAAAQTHKIWLLPGSLPVRTEAGIRNRAPLITPQGQIAFQEKRTTSRIERESWNVVSGRDPYVFATPWGRIGIAIGYDLEFPQLVRAQVEAGAWLILAPAHTASMAAFNRLRLAAQARAMENQCFVAIASTVGTAPWSATLTTNRGYGATFGPVDHGFPEDGILARGTLDAPGWVFADLDPARLEAVRWDGAVRNHQDWPPIPPRAQVLDPA